MDRSTYLVQCGDQIEKYMAEDVAYEALIRLLYPHVSEEQATEYFLDNYNLQYTFIHPSYKKWTTPWAVVEFFCQPPTYYLELIKDGETIRLRTLYDLKQAEDEAAQLMGWWMYVPWYGYTKEIVNADITQWRSSTDIIRIRLVQLSN